jgi:hypothetical protein
LFWSFASGAKSTRTSFRRFATSVKSCALRSSHISIHGLSLEARQTLMSELTNEGENVSWIEQLKIGSAISKSDDNISNTDTLSMLKMCNSTLLSGRPWWNAMSWADVDSGQESSLFRTGPIIKQGSCVPIEQQ